MASQFAAFNVPGIAGTREEAELNAFLRSHRIVQVSRQFVAMRDGGSWHLLVEYIDGANNLKGDAGNPTVDYRQVLEPRDFDLYRKLRELRKNVAEAQGQPVYAVFTNQQLADIARTRPISNIDLLKIDGIGQGRVERYGEAFLKLLAEYSGAPDRPAP